MPNGSTTLVDDEDSVRDVVHATPKIIPRRHPEQSEGSIRRDTSRLDSSSFSAPQNDMQGTGHFRVAEPDLQ